MNRIILITIAFVTFWNSYLQPTAASAADKVVLQLRWDHEFQFAGFYAAKWKGYFAREGLDIDIRSGVTKEQKFLSAPTEVLKGNAHFGIGAADLLPLIDKGHDLIIVNSFMQQSGNALYALARTPLNSPSDLTKLRVSRKVGDMVDTELLVLLQQEGINRATVPPHPYRFGLTPLLNGTVDVIPGRSLSVPWLAFKAGTPLKELKPVNYGINFYGDTLFTSASILEARPDLVEKFSRASKEGWRYALGNVDEIAGRISSELRRNFPLKDPLAYNLFEAKKVAELMIHPIVEIGHTNPYRWERMYELTAQAGVIRGGRNIRALVYDPVAIEQKMMERTIRWIAFIIGGLLIASIVYYIVALNRQRRLLLIANKQLQETRSQLHQSQKLEAVGQLAGGIAHDFNNILGIIIGNLDLIRLELRKEGKTSNYINVAKGGVERAAQITRKLLDFSRTSVADAQIVSVNNLIRDMENLVAKSLTATVEVDTHLSEALWPACIDGKEFENVLLNLSLNARDAMPNGGRLTIETSNKILDDKYVELNPVAETGEFVMISVNDTGTGMPPEVRERALEPFFTTKEQGKGTGLGLSMVYGFVQRSGGHIKIYTEPNKGTTIRIYLPRARESASQYDPAHAETERLSRGNETILVVDDEEQLVDVAVAYLESFGYTTRRAFNAESALEVLNEEREQEKEIDLVFIDVIMPGSMDGYELALAIRKAKPSTKCLLTSGFSRIREEYVNGEREYVSDLAANLLAKPYNGAELAIAIRHTLDESKHN